MTKHIELRLPDDLAARVDKRIADVNKGRDEPFSRNAWLVRAIQWAVDQPPTKRVTEETI